MTRKVKHPVARALARGAGKALSSGAESVRARWNGERRCSYFGCREMGSTMRNGQYYCSSCAGMLASVHGFVDRTPRHDRWNMTTKRWGV
jgi:hypothetical protein